MRELPLSGDDTGIHTVCIEATAEFLEFSRQCGNDLFIPVPGYRFPGLRPRDHWCPRAARRRLRATHEETLAMVDLETLKQFALDLT